jgi:hypothetical protein
VNEIEFFRLIRSTTMPSRIDNNFSFLFMNPGIIFPLMFAGK